MADPGAMSMFGPTVTAVGGHILSHMSTTRVPPIVLVILVIHDFCAYPPLPRSHCPLNHPPVAKIFDSPSMPEAEAVIATQPRASRPKPLVVRA